MKQTLGHVAWQSSRTSIPYTWRQNLALAALPLLGKRDNVKEYALHALQVHC